MNAFFIIQANQHRRTSILCNTEVADTWLEYNSGHGPCGTQQLGNTSKRVGNRHDTGNVNEQTRV